MSGNEIQLVDKQGASAGTFTLKFEEPLGNIQQPSNINWNATAAQVQTALGNLSNVGSNNVSVTSPNATGGPWTVVFIGTLSNKKFPKMTFTSALTGGTLSITDPIKGGPGADILRISPGEESKSNNDYPGYGPKFLMSHIAGSPRKFGSFFTCEAGRGLAGINVSCFHPADTSPSPTDTSPVRSHIDLVQRNIGQLPGVAANQRCVIGFSGNTLNAGALWLVGTDVGSNNNQHFFVYDNKNSKHRLFLKSTTDNQGGIAVNHFSPTAVFHLGPGYAAAAGAPFKFTSGTNLTTPELGAMEYDGARLAFTPGPSNRRSVGLSSDHKTATTTVAYNSGEVSVFTGTIAADEMAVGKTFIARVLGRYTTVNTTATFTIRCYLNGVLISGFTFDSAAGQISEAPLDVELIFTCRTTGMSGTVRAHAAVMLNHVDLSKGATGDTTLNTGGAQNVEIRVQWAAGTVINNLVSITQGFLQVLN